MLDINPSGKKVILSIDGGGLRGMIAIAMLAELERMTGKTCSQLFDMVAGTSTGAIIAAGIGLGIPAQDLLVDVYRNALPAAFRAQPRGLALYLRYALGGFRSLYTFDAFVELLSPFGAGKKVGDFSKPIVFMTTRDVRTANTYFVVSAGPGRERFKDWPVVGAVAASGSAPIFFPPVLGNLIDGGVGVHGNPCLAATVEALEYLGAAAGFTDGNVIHLSLGNGYFPNTNAEGAAGRFGIIRWLRYLIDESLTDSALNQVFSTRAIYRSRVDFRRYNVFLQAQSITANLGVSTQGRPDPAGLGNGLEALDDASIQLMEEIGTAYARKVDWMESGYMPWFQSGPQQGQGRDGGHPLPGVAPVKWDGSPYL